VHDPLGGVTTMTYDRDGRLETRTLPNGVHSTWTYDARSRVESIVHETSTGTVIASVAYVRSPSGEPTRITREDGTYVEYGYDDALRLERETYFDAAGAEVDEITYAYDGDGNRTRRTTSAGTEIYTYGSGSRLTSISIGGVPIAEYDYDGAGRVTRITRGGDVRDLTWDADDHITSIERGTSETLFDFDAQGRRVRAERRTAGTTTDVHRYLVAPTLAESLDSPHLATTEAGTPRAGWVFAGEHPLFRYDPATGDPIYYLADSMGSTIALVDDAGATSTIHYDGFGAERTTTGALAGLPTAAAGDFRFQGMWLDHGTGLYYVRARSYEVESGRFLSRDPAAGVRHNPASIAAYVFAYSAPATTVDPSGLVGLTDVMSAAVVERVLVGISFAAFGAGFLRGLQAASEVDRGVSSDDRLTAFANCIEQNTVDAAVAGATVVGGAPFLPIEKARAVALGLLARDARFAGATRLTSLASVFITRLARAFELAASTVNVARQFARGVSTITTPLLVGEGFYDVGLIGGCASVFLDG
jgi:RHS repeat-associated protein